MRKRVLHLKHAAKAVGNDGKHILSSIVSMICGLEFQLMPVDFVPRGKIFMQHCNRRGIVLALQIILNMQLCTSHQMSCERMGEPGASRAASRPNSNAKRTFADSYAPTG